jgi:hypothetical protein
MPDDRRNFEYHHHYQLADMLSAVKDSWVVGMAVLVALLFLGLFAFYVGSGQRATSTIQHLTKGQSVPPASPRQRIAPQL